MSACRRKRHSFHSHDGGKSEGESSNEEHASANTERKGDRLQREHFLKPDSDQIDLNLLLDAVLDINDKLKTHEQSQGSDNGEANDVCDVRCTSRTIEKKNQEHFLQKGSSANYISERQNYSFRNDQVLDIDRENRRLLREITKRHRPHSAASSRDRRSHKTVHEPIRVKTSSEVNRLRFQKRIDEENQALLRRLEAVKPTKSLDRDYLMKDYTVHERVKRRPASACSRSRAPSSRSRTLRSFQLETLDDAVLPKPLSGNSRNFSAGKAFTKPVWEAGW